MNYVLKRKPAGLVNHQLTVLLLAGLASGLWAEAASAPRVSIDNSPPKRETTAVNSYSGFIKKASPSVVNIFSTKIVKMPKNHPLLNDPFWGQFFGPGEEGEGSRESRRTRREQNLGSGVVISEDGYILTNFHVVEGSDEIKVAFAKSKEEYIAKVIGSDPPTDLAVLKIEAKGLPAVTFTDSDQRLPWALSAPWGGGALVSWIMRIIFKLMPQLTPVIPGVH
jgi:S1-C subfamily serine protease